MKNLLVFLAITLSLSCAKTEPAVTEAVTPVKEKSDLAIDPKSGKIQFTTKTIYFKHDDHTLTEKGMQQLDLLSAYLQKNPNLAILVSGHCDERGSTEYNLALGEQRSQAVMKYLISGGVAAQQLEAVSYGEEKPAVAGAGEEAWSKNRRAEFTLQEMNNALKAPAEEAAPAEGVMEKSRATEPEMSEPKASDSKAEPQKPVVE